jgi:hypothetical protein
MRRVHIGVVVLFTFLMLGTLTITAYASSPCTIIVKPSEGATLLPYGDGTEPPPHVIIYDKDGSLKMTVPNR